MTKKEEAVLLERVEENRKKVTASKRSAKAFLCRIGVYKKDGTLTKEYRTS